MRQNTCAQLSAVCTSQIKMSGKKSKGKGENLLEQEEVLQALVIADSFNEQFAPITRERPRVSC